MTVGARGWVVVGEAMSDERPWTLASLNTGLCHGCNEIKFIGHGPLCSDCYLGNETTEDR